MANSKLQMPANYMALNESEMSCVEGGGIISQVCYAFGRMFRSTYYDKWESESNMSSGQRHFTVHLPAQTSANTM